MMAAQVMEVMNEYGLIDVGDDPQANAEANANAVMRVFKAQGLMTANGDVRAGACILLPGASAGAGFKLLFTLPAIAEEHDGATLQRKRSPVTFGRTPQGEIIVPARWLLAKLEDLASNPSAPRDVRSLALALSRAKRDDIVLPAEAETVAVAVDYADERVIFEALPAGLVVSVEEVP
ncbi:MAG: hypothetical protein Q7W02_02365 [Candidatus Rokubacteria bacterium]|nr:hypothetical protein [Candidatus Rokubacteria bacterium]